MHLSLNNSLGKWILPKKPPLFSPEATNYFSRLDAAGDTTYVDYKQPLANYIDSLVSLGGAYWDNMQSSTSFVGVGIQGVTVPLRDGMTVPTQNNFVAGDLDQLTGLLCNGSTKRISTNTDQSNYAQNNTSASVYRTEDVSGTNPFYFGTNLADGFGARGIASFITACYGTQAVTGSASTTVGLLGLSRSVSTGYDYRSNGTTGTRTTASVAPAAGNLDIFAINGVANGSFRLATYHAGPALDLATLEGLQATLLSEIRTAHAFVAAASYFSRLAAAGDTTHVAYKQPLTNYITSLVELGGAYWDKMESAASFVGVGIQGVTVPLRDGMPTLTNNNFVAADLDQLTGLKGDASTKYLSTGVLDTATAQNDYSMSSWVTDPVYLDNAYWMGSARIAHRSSSTSSVVKFSTNNNSSSQINVTPDTADNFIGQVRTVGTEYDYLINTTSGTALKDSIAPTGAGISVFAYSAGTNPNASRIATYHYGPALDLATLQGLQATLLAEIAGVGFSTEAADYFGRLLNAGDKTFLAYRQPLANYIDSLVTLGGAYWDDMGSAASFVGVGIQGVTVPLKSTMSTLTNNNFVAGDLDPLTGLKGDGSTKYFDTSVKFNDFPQNDFSMSANITENISESTNGPFLIYNTFGDGISQISTQNDQGVNPNNLIVRCNNRTATNLIDLGGLSDFYGINRTLSTEYSVQYGASSTTVTETSQAPSNQIISIFGASTQLKVNARMATYHIGPALNLPTLRGLQATLITEIAAI